MPQMTAHDEKPRVTAHMFYKYGMCPHWLWFDKYGDPSKKGEISEFAEQLIESGLLHEKRVLEGMDYETVSGGTLEERFEATKALMAEGVERIYHGVLMTEDMVGEPDILERRNNHPSTFGAYHYIPVDIKSAERLSDSHKYQLTFYAELLKAVQAKRPKEAYILNGSMERIGFTIAEFELRFHKALRDVRTMLAGEKPAPHLSSGCKQSPWFGECVAYAEATQDIALLYNMRKKTVEALRKEGIRTVADAAKADVNRLFDTGEFTKKTLERMKLQARALRDGDHHLRRPFSFPEVEYEYFFDIEGDPLRQLEYLFGFLVRDPEGERYVPFVAEQPEDEKRMWDEFLAWLEGMPPRYAVYHYGSYERVRVASLESKYGGSKALTAFLGSLIDLNELIKKNVVFPLYFYSIKDIGKYIGFTRTGAITGGGESISYYEDWLQNGNRARLDAVIEYNEDDVVATRYLKDWLTIEAQKAAEDE